MSTTSTKKPALTEEQEKLSRGYMRTVIFSGGLHVAFLVLAFAVFAWMVNTEVTFLKLCAFTIPVAAQLAFAMVANNAYCKRHWLKQSAQQSAAG